MYMFMHTVRVTWCTRSRYGLFNGSDDVLNLGLVFALPLQRRQSCFWAETDTRNPHMVTGWGELASTVLEVIQ